MEQIYQQLVYSLEELISLYESLFVLLQDEKLILIDSNVEKLNESNQKKESVLFHIRQTDKKRSQYATELAKILGIEASQARLLVIADKLGPTRKSETEELKKLHQTLSSEIQKVMDLNAENENYTKTVLNILNGAIEDIKEAASGSKKKTYGKQGKTEQNPTQSSGNFVSKEA